MSTGSPRDEPTQHFRLVGRLVLIAHLHPEGRVHEGAEEPAERRSDEQGQRSSSAVGPGVVRGISVTVLSGLTPGTENGSMADLSESLVFTYPL